LDAARTGQEWAVACLYDALQPGLLRYLSWQEPQAAEDLASETWLAVAERIGRFEGDEDAFRGWLFAIARRRVADHRRRGARRRTTPVSQDDFAAMANADDPSAFVIDQLSSEEAIARLTELLPPHHAEVVLLRVVAGLSVSETARVVGKRPGAVRVMQHRALRRLASALQNELDVDA
jgi:RNA polymerase sigma-70 factor (ECF subfamily)